MAELIGAADPAVHQPEKWKATAKWNSSSDS
jgi:hypothetical protein